MTTKFFLPLLSLSLSLCFFGCDNKSAAPTTESAAATPNKHNHDSRPSVHYDTLAPTSTLMIVNGVALTKASLEMNCEIQTALASLSNKKITVEDVRKMQDRLRQGSLRRFLMRTVILDEAARRNLTVAPEEFTSFCESFAKNVTRRNKRLTFAQIKSRLSSQQALALEDDLKKDCLYQKIYKLLKDESHVDVTPEETARRYQQLLRYNEKARAAEAEIYQKATNTWQRLNMGEKFETAVKRFAGQAPRIDADMEWGTFQLNFFQKDDPQIYSLLRIMKEGQYTPPIEGNGGLIIVRLNHISPPEEADDPNGDYYQLGKIFFQLPEIFEITDEPSLQKRLIDELSKEKLERKLLDLQLAAKVDHPNGPIDWRPLHKTSPSALPPIQ